MSVTQHQSSSQLLLPPAVSLPREHLAAIQHIINDALTLQARSRATRPPPPPYNVHNSETQWFKPRMDMYESLCASGVRPLVTATFELPGLRKEEVHIDVLDDHMIIAGDRRHYPASATAVQESTRDDEMNDGEAGEKSEEGEITNMPEQQGQQGRAGYTVREIKRGRFRRVVPLPAGTKLDDIKASMHDGILTVTFPGTARPVAHSVPVA